MKATIVSYKVDVNKKIMLQHKHKSAIKMTGLKGNLTSITIVSWMLGSHLSCRTERNNLSVFFAARYWPTEVCYQISFNVI